MHSVYLYGILDGPPEDLETLSLAGLDGASRVRVLAHGGVGCVVSDHSGEDLRSVSRGKLLGYLLRHQQVVERVMQDHTVLPVKFGTTLDSPEEVRALLTQARQYLSGALESMRGKVEVEVAATWDVPRVLEAVRNDEAVVRTRVAIAAKIDPTLEEKVRLGQVVKACMDRRREVYREWMLAFLQPLSSGAAPNALFSEEMVTNVAFLVDGVQQPEFDRRVRELDELFRNEISFRVIGPLPPYSFSTVEITRLSEEQVEEARRELELAVVFVEAEVRRAYRRLVAREQRTALASEKLSSDRLARLRRASEVLLTSPKADGASEGKSLLAVAIRGNAHREVEAARFGAAVRV